MPDLEITGKGRDCAHAAHVVTTFSVEESRELLEHVRACVAAEGKYVFTVAVGADDLAPLIHDRIADLARAN